MKISAKLDYACRALIELALHWPNRSPLQIQVIGKKQGIPSNFLTHILIHLKTIGLVESVRGKNGGYYLSKAPDDISLKEIMLHFGEMGVMPQAPKASYGRKVMDNIWKELDQDLIKKMEAISLTKICDKIRSQDKALVYDI